MPETDSNKSQGMKSRDLERIRLRAESEYRKKQVPRSLPDHFSDYSDDTDSDSDSDSNDDSSYHPVHIHNRFSMSRYETLPRFFPDEIHSGKRLGKGAFGFVCEVTGISLRKNKNRHYSRYRRGTRDRQEPTEDSLGSDSCSTTRSSSSSSSNYSNSSSTTTTTTTCSSDKENYPLDSNRNLNAVARTLLASSFRDGGDGEGKYVLKGLRHKVVHGKASTLVQSMVDIATETRVLASLPRHRHIVRLHGVAATASPFHEDYFLVLDRLYGTLDTKLELWKQQDAKARSKSISNEDCHLDGHHHRRERLVACRDLASALAHLHRHGILHRDIKPDNIGFNGLGNLTLFDFGFARELPFTGDPIAIFRMTGFCGSPRYMAPEVGRKRPYNAKCDVYSFGVLTWEILALQKPFEGCGIADMKETVWKGSRGLCDPGDPFGSSRLSASLSSLPSQWSSSSFSSSSARWMPWSGVVSAGIEATWNRMICLRPTMAELRDCLREACLELDHPDHPDPTEANQEEEKRDDSVARIVRQRSIHRVRSSPRGRRSRTES